MYKYMTYKIEGEERERGMQSRGLLQPLLSPTTKSAACESRHLYPILEKPYAV